ncbi:MAG: hypothetical protein U0792_23270 [Gemmataceae bacterium]
MTRYRGRACRSADVLRPQPGDLRSFPGGATAPPRTREDRIDAVTPISNIGKEFEQLAKTAPLAMYQQCLAHYQRTATGFTATLVKKERLKGEPKSWKDVREEVIELAVRGDTPDPVTGKHCIEVSMWWVSGAKTALGSQIRGTLYSEKPGAEGTGGNVVSFRPGALLKPITEVPAAGSLAKGQSRCLHSGCGRVSGHAPHLRCMEAPPRSRHPEDGIHREAGQYY